VHGEARRHPRAWEADVAALIILLATVPLAQADVPSHSPITASSTMDERYLAEFALDGDVSTRWASASAGADPEWLMLDLGSQRLLGALALRWEAAYAAHYAVEISDEGQEWTRVYEQAAGVGGVETLPSVAQTCRFVRILCLGVGPFGLYSLWEVEGADEEGREAIRAARAVLEERQEAARAVLRDRIASAFGEDGVEEIVFATRIPASAADGHWYANFGYYAGSVDHLTYLPGWGRLCALNLSTGEVRVLLEDEQGCVRDPQVDSTGGRVIFSYLPAGDRHYHLYEIRADGTGLRQLTDGPWDDIEPTFLPDGDIMFVSSRAKRWVNCWLTQVGTLHRCRPDGSGIQLLSSNLEHDNTPWLLHDGRILYTRWEYVDRSQVDYHGLWTMNPDGTGQMTFFGNMHPGTVMIDAKPVPGTNEVISIFSPGHGLMEHAGALTLLDPGDGPDNRARARAVAPGANVRDPFALNPDLFVAAVDHEIRIYERGGTWVPLYALPPEDVARGLWIHEPRLLRAAQAPPQIAPRVNLSRADATLILTDVYHGRRLDGVERGEITDLLVIEPLPKPINYTGGMDPLTYGGTFTLERLVGTVPVEPDGSAHFRLPALRSFFFVALDADGQAVKRMQSFCSLQPGEQQGCVGCHEERTQTPRAGVEPMAARQSPELPRPIEGMPQVFDFPRDIQPILDAHCLRCHDYVQHEEQGPRAGGVILSGDHGPMFSHSYYELTVRRQIVDGRNDPISNLAPRTIGAVASPLWHKIEQGHQGVQLSGREKDTVRLWIETGAVYPGTYGALGSGMIGGYYANGQVGTDFDWPEAHAASETVESRCVQCHQGEKVLPRNLSDERDVSFWRPDWSDPRLPLARHAVWNLTRPELSLMLLAPLAADAGGYGTCREAGGAAVFASVEDPGYAALLALARAGKARLEEIGRFDMHGFRPPEPYLREMARYGVIDAIPPEGEPVDPYTLDESYWRSLWWSPQ
jgi:hypothetical protein